MCQQLQDGTKPKQLTWEPSEKNIYVLQVYLQTFYTVEKSMNRKFSAAQKSIDFLNKTMKEPKYAASSKIFKSKIMERGLDKKPPFNVGLNEIATTLESETTEEIDSDNIILFANRLTPSGQSYRPPSLQPTASNRGPV